MVIPTLAADQRLVECLRALGRQTLADFEIWVVDNSGLNRARRTLESAGLASGIQLIENHENAGFGAAINQAARRSRAEFVATLNDDAEAEPGWLAEMLAALERHPEAGMCAPQVRLAGREALDSAGMLICGDGSSKQRGHLARPQEYGGEAEVLFPSGSAALYRRAVLDDAGLFDEGFFLYCEDTDLGLRARWAGWTGVYAPRAVVRHHYSHSSGRASALKAYHVERNRLFVLVKNFPAPLLCRAPFVTLTRYGWHLYYLLRNRGAAAGFRNEGNSAFQLAWFVARAHAAVLLRLPRLWRERNRIRRTARISAAEFSRLMRRHSISAREVAAL